MLMERDFDKIIIKAKVFLLVAKGASYN